jgi:hypothetical protein
MKLNPRNSLAAWLSVYSPTHGMPDCREFIANLTDCQVDVMVEAIQLYKEAIINERKQSAIFPSN